MADRQDLRWTCGQAGEDGAGSKAHLGTITYMSRRDNVDLRLPGTAIFVARRRDCLRCFHGSPFHGSLATATTLTDILADVLGGQMAGSRRDGRAGQDVLRRVGEASVLILISLADGPKHGYALIQDIKELAGVELGPGTLYGALDRLEPLGLIESLPAEDRRHPYRITAPGAAALRVHLDSLERVSAAGRLRLRLGGI
jgi:DNA-binding PadR family transcriptional regulator